MSLLLYVARPLPLRVAAALGCALAWYSPLGGQQFDRPRSEVESAMIVLYPDGFSPKQVNFREGRVVLSVLNRAGIDEMPLLFQRDAESLRPAVTIDEKDVPRSQRAWRPDVELAAGTYTLSFKGRPEWICRIIVAPDPGK